MQPSREYERLRRELSVATTPSQVHDVLHMAVLARLPSHEKTQLISQVPKFAFADPRAAIIGLQALDVAAGTATKWSKTLPWRTNPWQLMQVSAARAITAFVPQFSPTLRLSLLPMAREIAIAGNPSQAWTAAEVLATMDPHGDQALSLAARFLLSAWATLNVSDRGGAPALVRKWVEGTAKLTGRSESAAKAATTRANQALTSSPEQALADLKEDFEVPAALIEVLATVAVLHHLRDTADAELCLDRFLQQKTMH